ncbi:MAG TPA: (d)CMP kinase [Acidobacteriaceae bacterium]|nr:(d)CMP kinase [Acidobacteriaceae bacterium]
MTENQSSPLVVAIDGPAGAGKSTVAARVAGRFGLLNLESGAMYRAFALKAIQTDSDLDDREELGRLAERTRIRLLPAALGNRVFLDDVEVTKRIREPDVTAAASRVSVHPGIRQWMVSMQRQLGASSGIGIVMEGRDIGTKVFPNARVKIFLDAAAEVRGQRRYQQNGPGALPAESVLEQLRERDRRDRTRAESPLQPAVDAVIIDSTDLSLDQVVARVEAIITDRLAAG